MKKLDLYIIRKFLGTFFYAIALLAVIIIIFDISEKIDDFLEKKPPLNAIIFQYYANFIPYFINLFSALFTFIAVIFFTSKMASNTEIIAILNSGISFKRMLRPYIISATFLALMSFTLSNFIIPVTSKNMQEFQKTYLKGRQKSGQNNIHMQISPGVFAYLENFDAVKKSGFRFSLEQFDNDGMTEKLTADQLIWDSISGLWTIKNWVRREIGPKGEVISRGATLDTLLNLKPTDFYVDVDDAIYMGYRELRQFIEMEKMRGSGNLLTFEIEKHKRIAFPFATIILTVIGVSLSSRKVRGGIGFHLGIGITICFAFILFMQITTVFATLGNLPPVIAVWIPNFIFGILSIYLLRVAPK
ncbi:MAG: LptF/LptG family permease [Lentimicrobium sp.]|jgi:lipopolysaccharide export system permease protein|nr:LptF/LptG family permease [Lentimicrobium sp.]MDD2527236.1 LptF/LptG family permease [Lentimicrobiaceae bacterium]MDD4596585.1 LptF/LptG family permease [Lentimicrobiaceae bacterium]MDY0024880.1 LptF/LptG family permease [Lentimicrobium sp.]